MSETVPGGVYEGPKGHYHDADGKEIPKADALKLIKQVAELNSAPVVLEQPAAPADLTVKPLTAAEKKAAAASAAKQPA